MRETVFHWSETSQPRPRGGVIERCTSPDHQMPSWKLPTQGHRPECQDCGEGHPLAALTKHGRSGLSFPSFSRGAALCWQLRALLKPREKRTHGHLRGVAPEQGAGHAVS